MLISGANAKQEYAFGPLPSFAMTRTSRLCSHLPHSIHLQLTALRYGTPINAGETIDIPFSFHSEIAPQDLGLVVLVDFSDAVRFL